MPSRGGTVWPAPKLFWGNPSTARPFGGYATIPTRDQSDAEASEGGTILGPRAPSVARISPSLI